MRKSCGQCRHYKVNRYLESICTLTGKNVGYLWDGEDSCFEPLSLPKPPTNDNKVEPNDNKLKPEAMETPDKKICKCCGRELTIEHFQPNPRCKDGHLDTCKECMNAKRESSRKKNLLGTAIPAPKEDAAEKAILDKLIENDARMDENGFTLQMDKKRKIIYEGKGGVAAGICSEERSMISPDYARNFICDFILGRKQPEIDPQLF